MSFSLNKLPYAAEALAPLISAETLSFHYGKHHAGYVAKLNELTNGTPLASKSIQDLCKTRQKIPAGVFNSAAQIYNHDFYWKSLAPPASGIAEKGPLEGISKSIDASFGSFENFKKEFSAAAAGHFGSGWAWLVLDRTKNPTLKIHQTHDAGTPLEDANLIPLLTCDVWEHAYYIDYRNARPSYIDAWWKLVNWEFAEKNLKDALIVGKTA